MTRFKPGDMLYSTDAEEMYNNANDFSTFIYLGKTYDETTESNAFAMLCLYSSEDSLRRLLSSHIRPPSLSLDMNPYFNTVLNFCVDNPLEQQHLIFLFDAIRNEEHKIRYHEQQQYFSVYFPRIDQPKDVRKSITTIMEHSTYVLSDSQFEHLKILKDPHHAFMDMAEAIRFKELNPPLDIPVPDEDKTGDAYADMMNYYVSVMNPLFLAHSKGLNLPFVNLPRTSL